MCLLASHLRDTVTEKVRNPNICSIKCDPIHGEVAHSESAEDLAIDCPDLTHIVARGICHPDVRTIKCDSVWKAANCEVPENGAITDSNFADSVAGIVGNPDVGTIKRHR